MTASPVSSQDSAHAGTIISVAVTGAHTKAEVPALPVGSEEVATAVADCERVGAAVVDLEPRHDSSIPDVVAAIRARTELVVRVAAYPRSETLATLLDSGADVLTCPLDAPSEFITDLHDGASERGLAVHYEARESATPDNLTETCAADQWPPHVVLPFGERSNERAGELRGLASAIGALPDAASFTAYATGASSMPVLLATLAGGGHPRVGMADTLEYAPGIAARDNAQLVARAVGLAKIAQRPPLSACAAREMLTSRAT